MFYRTVLDLNTQILLGEQYKTQKLLIIKSSPVSLFRPS